MHVSVELGFDPASERRIQGLWGTLAAIYGGPRKTELGVRPHLSLTSFSHGEPSFLRRELEDLARRTRPFRIRFASVASFPTPEGVVYLAPSPSEDLREVHGVFHRAMAVHGEAGNPYYQPGKWVPHCTVATDVPDDLRELVVKTCRREGLMEVVVGSIHATAYRPARELYGLSLVGDRSA